MGNETRYLTGLRSYWQFLDTVAPLPSRCDREKAGCSTRMVRLP